MAEENLLSELPFCSKQAVDVFTHSSTLFPGAWTEDDISILLDAWEKAVEAPRPPFAGKPFDLAEKVVEMLAEVGFQAEKDEVLKKMGTLRTEYRVYRGLVTIGIPAVKGDCVPQLERIFRKTNPRKARRRRTSTVSNQNGGMSEDDTVNQNEIPSRPESADENKVRNKRVRFQRQTLQRSFRTVIGQQKALMEYLPNVFKLIEESISKISTLLELLASKAASAQTELS